MWSRELPEKNGTDRLSRFGVYWIKTVKQTDRQSIYRK